MDYSKTTPEEAFGDFTHRLLSGEQIGAEETGKLILLMAHHYGTLAGVLPAAERKVNALLATTIQSNDKETGKPMSAAKADILVKSSDEYNVLNISKAKMDTLETYINALKAMARAQTGEFQQVG